MEKVSIFCEDCSARHKEITEESTPPERNVPNGTSEIDLLCTLSRIFWAAIVVASCFEIPL